MQSPFIRNFDQLATTPLRRDALAILEAGYEAVETARVILSEVEVKDNDICVKGKNICLSDFERIFYIGIGKCAVDASLVFEQLLGSRIQDGIVLDVKSGVFQHVRSFVGTHPFPSEENVSHTKEIIKMLADVTERDLVIVVVSGGGSSLLCMPYNINCNALTEITEALWKRGASIHEVNVVRKHLSEIQGGQLAKIAYPATVLSFIFSDVPGNDVSVIASGPTVMDTSTADDAAKVLAKYDVMKECNMPLCDLVETPKEQKYFDRVMNMLMVTNERALEAMKTKALSLGFDAHIKDTSLEGIAAKLGKEIASMPLSSRSCVLYGGETTVELRGKGVGGRNQEFALSAVEVIPHQRVLVAAASDGWDNCDSAGALCDAGDRERAKVRNISPEWYLENNDSYHFWELVNGRIETGRTGINVADFYFVVSE